MMLSVKNEMPQLLSAVLILLAPCALAGAPDDTGVLQEVSSEVQARITRVEHGLSNRVVIKGRSGQKMSLAERMAFHDVPAVSIAVINNGRVEWARAYGVLDVTSQRPATTASLFQAGSVSKPVSALGAFQHLENPG